MIFFFFNDTATTEIYTLSLHDALPICDRCRAATVRSGLACDATESAHPGWRRSRHGRCATRQDRKSTRLNSSHSQISYAVFCLKKKNNNPHTVASDAREQPRQGAHSDL